MTTPYIDVSAAETYFQDRLTKDAWTNATASDKATSLRNATRIIDRLNIAGAKALPDQEREFPRGTSLAVPKDILDACCEIALVLLDGVDPDAEITDLRTTEHIFAGVRTMYNPNAVPDHVRAGVPSPTAWGLLVPYLRSPREVHINRMD